MVRLVRELVTTFLDTVALLLMAAGLAAMTYRYLEWGCLLVAGVVVLTGSLLAAREPKQKDRKSEPLL